MATSLTAYTDARAALIAEERSLRLDHQPQYLETLGPAEVVRKADEILRKFRKMEAVSMWCVETEQIPNIFPGMEFLTAKEVIQATELFRWVKKLPKGALLHAHMDAMCDARFLLDRALEQPQMHVRAQSVITSESIRSMLPEFSALPLNYQETSPHNLTDPLYKAESWVPLQVARQTFPAELGGIEGFDKWVLGTLRIDPNEAYVQYNTSKKIWKKFQSTFGVAAGLIGFEPILRAYFRELLLSSVEDGVSYVEARIMFFDKFMVRANGERNFSHREWVKMFSEVIEEVRQELASQGRDDEFVGAKVIYTTLRFITPDELDWYFEDCIALKKEFPHIIAGFDLVGHEDVGIPLLTYLPKLLEFQENVKSQGLYIPFIFHAGETLGDGDVVDDNLYDAVLLGTKRIGHGFSLAKHPHLLKLCRERGIAIEVCPISNEILRLTSSMPTHPLPIVLNNGVQVALSCDDPSVFGNLGLSYDFYQVMVASEITGLTTLGIMARQSLVVSELEPAEKAKALEKWDRRWKIFLDEVLAHGDVIA